MRTYVTFDKNIKKLTSKKDTSFLILLNKYIDSIIENKDVFTPKQITSFKNKLQSYSFFDFNFTVRLESSLLDELILSCKKIEITFAKLPSNDFYKKTYSKF